MRKEETSRYVGERDGLGTPGSKVPAAVIGANEEGSTTGDSARSEAATVMACAPLAKRPTSALWTAQQSTLTVSLSPQSWPIASQQAWCCCFSDIWAIAAKQVAEDANAKASARTPPSNREPRVAGRFMCRDSCWRVAGRRVKQKLNIRHACALSAESQWPA